MATTLTQAEPYKQYSLATAAGTRFLIPGEKYNSRSSYLIQLNAVSETMVLNAWGNSTKLTEVKQKEVDYKLLFFNSIFKKALDHGGFTPEFAGPQVARMLMKGNLI